MLLLIIFRGRLRALELSYVQSNRCYMNVNKLIKYDVDNVFNVSFLFIFERSEGRLTSSHTKKNIAWVSELSPG